MLRFLQSVGPDRVEQPVSCTVFAGLERDQRFGDQIVDHLQIVRRLLVQAMKAGAVEFLTKPYRDQDLLEAVLAAIEKDRQRRADERGIADTQRRFEALTSRERQVMALTISGLQTKQIAGAAAISEVTVRVHRREIMRKMNARSLADLVKMGETLRGRGVVLRSQPSPDE